MKKRFKLDASDFKRLIPDIGYCLATDMITVDGDKVGYMYRETPDEESDSGWRLFSGQESDEYVNNQDNIGLYAVNTIANYDPEIIPYLLSTVNTAFSRDPETGNSLKRTLLHRKDKSWR